MVVRPIVKRFTQVPPVAAPAPAPAGSARTDLVVGTAAEASDGSDAAAASVDGVAGMAEGEVELREGETIEELKARLKPKKKGISADLLDTANSYDDKVTVVRMMVSQDSKRVSLVLKNLISRDLG